jgi:hypothetical protein
MSPSNAKNKPAIEHNFLKLKNPEGQLQDIVLALYAHFL